MSQDPPPLGWLGILRLGLVQTALGAVVVLTTSAINRVMVVELALAASVPGLLVVQLALMARLLRDPRALAPWYNATGVTLYVLGMLVCAFALRPEMAG